MTWVRLDDLFSEDPRIAAVGLSGQGLMVAALCYTNRTLTDGWVPSAAARQMTLGPKKLITTMVEVGLWEERERDGIPRGDTSLGASGRNVVVCRSTEGYRKTS